MPPTGDVEVGKKVYMTKCALCHTVEKGGRHLSGPNLGGLIGSKAGTAQGYVFSEANKSIGVTWTWDTLSQFLENPKKFMPGTKMMFAGMKKEKERADLYAYLETATK
ncbi:cytochrome c-like [Lycorma delicatula]|uniref:cytochrome c-like n=1 Tax=Lycorma delicatula TaxID=130591 RepID=UPI003F519A36